MKKVLAILSLSMIFTGCATVQETGLNLVNSLTQIDTTNPYKQPLHRTLTKAEIEEYVQKDFERCLIRIKGSYEELECYRVGNDIKQRLKSK